MLTPELARIILGIMGIVLAFVLAVLVGGIRNASRARRYRIARDLRPIGEQIDEIRECARHRIRDFETMCDRHGEATAQVWILETLKYYRRLEGLASDPNASADEIIRLADEAEDYIRQHRLKGIFVAQDARRLAALIGKNEAA